MNHASAPLSLLTTPGPEVVIADTRPLVEIDRRVAHDLRFGAAVAASRRAATFDAPILGALASFVPAAEGTTQRLVGVKHLVVGMVLVEDVLAKSGAVNVGRGVEVRQVVRERLLNFARGGGVREPVRVRGAS